MTPDVKRGTNCSMLISDLNSYELLGLNSVLGRLCTISARVDNRYCCSKQGLLSRSSQEGEGKCLK